MDIFISLKEDHFQELLFQEETIFFSKKRNLYDFIDHEYL